MGAVTTGDNRSQNDQVIADCVSELRELNERIFAAKEKQKKLKTIKQVPERSRESG